MLKMSKTNENIKWGMFSTFPRVMGNPYRNAIAHDINDVNKYIEDHKRDYGGVHISVYSYFTVDYDSYQVDDYSAHVDKIFLDIDEDGWLEDIRKLDLWLEKNNIVRTYTMSGKGNQTLIGCNPNISNKKNAIGNFQDFIQKKFNIKLDPSNIGDLARSFRIPNIYNYKRKRYCIPLTRDIIHSYTKEEIYDLAKEPFSPKESTIYGKNLINLKNFDTEETMYKVSGTLEIDGFKILSKEDLEKLDIPYEKFPQCINYWLNMGRLGFKGRWLLLLYLRDQQINRDDGSKLMLSRNAIISILRHCLDDETYRHAFTSEHLKGHNVGENMIPIKKTLSKLGYNMYSCEKIKMLGLCPSKECKRKHPIYEYN